VKNELGGKGAGLDGPKKPVRRANMQARSGRVVMGESSGRQMDRGGWVREMFRRQHF